ncbi:hypothetical protein WA026_022456 [Henosepilachna vigintioctopunctata]|uniref:Retrovirus-related Pol polyprotein from transposon TNT 1-94 n=1 Tax=Henosepilachna vigintioctopunctata TaxID=420089 RepID=A0AAW1TY94_9CUCU
MNRSIIEKSRCLLFDAGLDKSFWAEAVNTAVFLINRSVTSCLDNKTPYEVWHSRKPNVEKLRIFGSKAMVHIPKEKRRKWDKKATSMIFVGYSENIKGFRLYDPTTRKIVTSRDVTIDERHPEVKVIIQEHSNELFEHEDSVGDSSSDESNQIDAEINDQSDADYIPEDVTLDVEQVRRSTRQPKTKIYPDHVTYLCSPGYVETILEDVPLTVPEALSSPDAEKWKVAMLNEMHSFEENDTWELVKPPKEGTVVECKWVYKLKSGNDNSVVYRARLVAKGYTQKENVDYKETFAPVVRHSTLKLLLSLSVKLDLDITHLDVTTAFLNGFLEETVYMRQPEGFVKKGFENHVFKLKKAIYGLKQASRAWYMRVDEILLSLDYLKSQHEPCLYYKRKKESITIIALYVDDFFVFSNDINESVNLKSCLKSKFKVKDLGHAKQILGVKITRDQDNKCLYLDQESYIDSLLSKFKMTECKGMKTPLDTSLDFNKVDENICDPNIPYQNLIGGLMYLAILTRPDIAFSVSFLSQYNNKYTNVHWQSAKRILRYLKQTKKLKLKYFKNDIDLQGFADADWANDKNDRRSYTGFVFRLSGGAISWQSTKQKTVALSSTEAEYMALSEAAKEAIYLKNLLFELFHFKDKIVVFNDNQAAQKLSANQSNHCRTKHIDVRHHFIRDCVDQKLIDVQYISTNEMVADILTKGLTNVKNSYFCSKLGLVYV